MTRTGSSGTPAQGSAFTQTWQSQYLNHGMLRLAWAVKLVDGKECPFDGEGFAVDAARQSDVRAVAYRNNLNTFRQIVHINSITLDSSSCVLLLAIVICSEYSAASLDTELAQFQIL